MEQEIIISGDRLQYQKMTATPVPRLVMMLAAPTVVSMLVSALYNTADTFFVSKLGTSASAAVGVVFSLMAIFQAIGFTLGSGAGSVIPRKLGAKDVPSASRLASTAFFLALTSGLMLTVFGLLNLDKLMLMLGSTPTILPFSKSYAMYILLGAPIMCASFVMNNILRAEGKAAFAMTGLVTGGFINIALDPVFIFTLGLGISGAAIATLISQLISFMILYSFFLRGKSTSKILWELLSKNVADYIEILRFGFPSLCRQGLASIATVSLNVNAALYGDAAVAAMSIVGRIFMFILSVVIGIGQGFMPVAGFNYGAKKYGRVREAVRFTVKAGFLMMCVMGGLGIIFAPRLIAIFRNDAEVIAIGTLAMRIQCAVIILQPFFVTTNMALQATGHASSSTFLACNKQGLYFLPLIFILPGMFGLLGVQITQPISDILSFLTAMPFMYFFIKRLNSLESFEKENNN